MKKKKLYFQKIKEGLLSNKPLFFILLLSAFLRLYRIGGFMEFLGDQGRDVLVVHRFLTQGDLMFIGPQTSIGNMYLGPWYYYLMAPALLVSNFHPIGPAILVALLGVLTVWLTYKVGKEWFKDEFVGLASALLMAVSPVVIAYNNFSWNPNIMPLFSLLCFHFTYRIWQKKEYKQLPWLAASLAMVLNSHYLGLLLIPIIGLFMILSFWEIKRDGVQKKKLFSSFGLAVVVFLLLFLPLILFDLKHGLSNFNSFKAFFTVRQTTVNLKVYKGLDRFWEIANQLIANIFIRKEEWALSSLVLLVLGLGGWFLRKTKAFWLIAVWVFLSLVGLGNYKQHIYAHYFGFLWPAIIIWLAGTLKLFKKVGWLVLLGILILMISSWRGWRPPQNQARRAQLGARAICAKVKENSVVDYNIVNLASYNDFRAMSYRYFLVKECPLPPLGLHQYPEAKNLMIVAEDQSKYPDPLAADVWEIQAGGGWEIKESWKTFDTLFYYLSKNSLDNGIIPE